MKNTKSFDTISAALTDFRAELRQRYIEAYKFRLDGLKARLEAANGDINKTHPYPSSQQSRKSYVQAKNEYEYARASTEDPPLGKAPYDEWVKYESCEEKILTRRQSHMPGAPRYVQMKQSAYDNSEKNAIRDADNEVDSYIWKLVGKIGKEKDICSAAYEGRLWFGSLLTVNCADEKQVWKTKCILNVSCLGNVFNQWPTRRVS